MKISKSPDGRVYAFCLLLCVPPLVAIAADSFRFGAGVAAVMCYVVSMIFLLDSN